MKLKPSKSAIKNFEFLSLTQLDMVGIQIGNPIPLSPSGHSALDCWFAKDTHGVVLPCREPDILSKVQRSKASWNLQIKLWAEDFAGGLLLTQEELKSYCKELPTWIFKAVKNQSHRILLEKIGFIPSFAR